MITATKADGIIQWGAEGITELTAPTPKQGHVPTLHPQWSVGTLLVSSLCCILQRTAP